MNTNRLLENTFVADIEHRISVESTNTLALQLMDAPRRFPLLVLADHQTGGRGRGGNQWWSATGALTFSLVLRSGVSGPTPSPCSLAAGLAVRNAIAGHAPDTAVQLKWPNDVWLNGLKVAGILIERPASNPAGLVIGIGINVNNSLESAPAEIRDVATSIIDVRGEPTQREALLTDVLSALDIELQQIGNTDRITREWAQYCGLTGRKIQVRHGHRTDRGECLGITANGSLRLKTATGEELSIASGSIERMS